MWAAFHDLFVSVNVCNASSVCICKFSRECLYVGTYCPTKGHHGILKDDDDKQFFRWPWGPCLFSFAIVDLKNN